MKKFILLSFIITTILLSCSNQPTDIQNNSFYGKWVFNGFYGKDSKDTFSIIKMDCCPYIVFLQDLNYYTDSVIFRGIPTDTEFNGQRVNGNTYNLYLKLANEDSLYGWKTPFVLTGLPKDTSRCYAKRIK